MVKVKGPFQEVPHLPGQGSGEISPAGGVGVGCGSHGRNL